MRQVWRAGDGSSEDPFALRSGLTARCCSLRLQRAVLAFGLDFPYAECVGQLAEHYSVDVPKSTVRAIVNRHCEAIAAAPEAPVGALPSEGKRCVIVEADGSMLPIAVFEDGPDRRRTKRVEWREFKLCAARAQGSETTKYGGGFCSAEQFAPKWERCALAAGWGARSRIHGLGDGAEWIDRLFERSFAARGAYLLDFFHLSEHLAEAGKAAGADEGWLRRQQALLKRSRAGEVVAELDLLSLADGCEPGPLGDALRYMLNREGQLDYAAALQADLPIGSGMIESGHRHLLQRRLKIAGAWKLENADNLARSRIARKNAGFDRYWKDLAQPKAA